jgi:hypothetical protein
MPPNRSLVGKQIGFNYLGVLQRRITKGNSPCNFFGFASRLDCEVASQKCSDSCLKTNGFVPAGGHQSKTALTPTVNPYRSQEMVKFRTRKVVEIVRAMKAKEINPYPC